MKAIVTGGTGFIGSYLIEQLVQRKYEVCCIAKDKMHATELESLNIEIIQGDINNGISWQPILKDADYIYHLAGVTRATRLSDYFDGNFHATRRVIQQSLTHCQNLQRFIYVSSLAAVGPAQDENPLTEETMYHPVSAYGKSKMLAELEVLKLRSRLPFTILRPSAVYGPRDRDMYTYIALLQKRIQPMIGFRKKWLNLIHRDDLVEGIILAATSVEGANEIFFLGGETNYTTEQIGDIIASVIQKSRLKFHLPECFVYIAGSLAEIAGKISRKDVFFNRQKVTEAVQTYWTCSIEKAKHLLDFKESYSLEEGMRNTYEWYLEKQWL